LILIKDVIFKKTKSEKTQFCLWLGPFVEKMQASIVMLINTPTNFPTCIQSEFPLTLKHTRGCTAAFNVVGKLCTGTYGTRVFWDCVYTEKSAHLCKLPTPSKGKWHSCFFASCEGI